MPRAEDMYETFHGKAPRRITTAQVPEFDELVVLGQGVAIEYKCDKLNGGGDGTQAIYRHELDKTDLVCTDPSGRCVVIIGPKLRVREEGIVD